MIEYRMRIEGTGMPETLDVEGPNLFQALVAGLMHLPARLPEDMLRIEIKRVRTEEDRKALSGDLDPDWIPVSDK